MSKSEREVEIVNAINKRVTACDGQVVGIKTQWKENYDMFVHGTVNHEKQEWQANFSTNKLSTSIRTAQGKLFSKLVQAPDYYSLEPRSPNNPQADQLAPAFKKILDYYLEAAKFKRHSGNFFLCSLISMGSLYVGWKSRLLQNPEFVIQETEKERRKQQQALAKHVLNPQVEDPGLGGDGLASEIADDLEAFMAEATGQTVEKQKAPRYIQVGCLDFVDINAEKTYWEPNVQYMEDSPWKAFDIEVNRYELEQQAKLGLISKAKLKKVVDGSSNTVNVDAIARARYKNLTNNPGTQLDLVKLRFYFGNLVIDNKVVKDNYYCIIANDSTILKEGEYPFWEPPGHHTPIISAAVRQIPYRPTGAGIGDNALPLQKTLDSNYQLVCDQARFAVVGLNILNANNLVDKSQLDEGIYPGMNLKFRSGTPKDNFAHIDIAGKTDSLTPINNIIERAMDTSTGVNELMIGGNNPYSRTSARETEARMEAGNSSVNTIALDLETNYMVPALEKCFARVLQFGLSEINNNPELSNLLSEEEKMLIGQLQVENRLNILTQWYTFKINGFSEANNKNERAMRDNELLNLINSGGIVGQFINTPKLLEEYFKNRDIKDPDILLLKNTPYQQAIEENSVLMTNHAVMPSQNDDHNIHMQAHMPLANSPYATPELKQHVMYHQQLLMMMQQAQQQGNPNDQGSGSGQT